MVAPPVSAVSHLYTCRALQPPGKCLTLEAVRACLEMNSTEQPRGGKMKGM